MYAASLVMEPDSILSVLFSLFPKFYLLCFMNFKLCFSLESILVSIDGYLELDYICTCVTGNVFIGF